MDEDNDDAELMEDVNDDRDSVSKSQKSQRDTNIMMANLGISFREDVEDLEDNDNESLDEDIDDAEHMEEDVNGELVDIEALNYDDLDSVSKLHKSERYTDIIKKVEDALAKGSNMSNQGMVLENDPEYQLILKCNSLADDIKNGIVIIHNFIRAKVRLKFPELESLVHHPNEYARAVKMIVNEVDLTAVDPLPKDALQKTIDACDLVLTLNESKKKVLEFIESRMFYIAPNLSAIVGIAVAAKLMGTAGGLSSLAKMPACNVQLLGAKALAGFSTATSQLSVGYIEQTEVFQAAPPAFKMLVCRLLAEKSILAAHLDSVREHPSGSQGRSYQKDIRKKFEKWQEPSSAKQPKPLPVPDSKPKKKRKKKKEKYAFTDMQEIVNRLQFGIPEESSLGDGLGEGSVQKKKD